MTGNQLLKYSVSRGVLYNRLCIDVFTSCEIDVNEEVNINRLIDMYTHQKKGNISEATLRLYICRIKNMYKSYYIADRSESNLVRYKVPLRVDVMVDISLPPDLKQGDIERLNNFLKALTFEGV